MTVRSRGPRDRSGLPEPRPGRNPRDRVPRAVARKDGVVSGTAEETIYTDAAHERVGAAEAVEDVAAGEPEQAVRPVRAAECVPPGGTRAYRPPYTLRSVDGGDGESTAAGSILNVASLSAGFVSV